MTFAEGKATDREQNNQNYNLKIFKIVWLTTRTKMAAAIILYFLHYISRLTARLVVKYPPDVFISESDLSFTNSIFSPLRRD